MLYVKADGFLREQKWSDNLVILIVHCQVLAESIGENTFKTHSERMICLICQGTSPEINLDNPPQNVFRGWYKEITER